MGQAMDIQWHRNISIIPEIEDYYLMCKMKTSSLARLAAELGAHAAGASQEIINIIANAADMVGIGFQILDDVKNLTTGNPGKKLGDDVVEGKKGLPVLLYMHKYPEKRERIFYCFHVAKREGTNAPEVGELIDALKATDVFAEAEEKGRALIKNAQEIFKSSEFTGYPLNENSRSLLDNLIKLIS